MTPKRWMLCVGVSDYGAQPGLPNLPWAVNDAALIFETLESEYNFQGRLLAHRRDLAAGTHPGLASVGIGNGSRGELIDQIDWLRLRMSAEDFFVFFYSGHSSSQGVASLLPYGTSPNDLKSEMSFRELVGHFAALPCRQMFLLLNCGFPPAVAPSALALGDSEQNMIILAAGKAELETPERSLSTRHSPYASAIESYLRDGLKHGDTVRPDQLFAFVRQHGVESALFHELNRGQAPTGSLLQRPLIQIHVGIPVAPRAGEVFAIEARAERRSGDPATWLPKLYRRQVLGNGDQWMQEIELKKVCLEHPGEHILDCVATDSATGEQAVRTVTIDVGERIEKPFVLASSRLPPCLKAKSYEARIRVEGGRAPYANLVVEGPNFLQAELSQSGTSDEPACIILRAHVKDHPDAGTPKSLDVMPTLFDLRIAVQDAIGRSAASRYRLLVFSPKDYCHISSGEFEVGYHERLNQNKAIADMLTELARKVTDERLIVPLDMQRMVRAVGKGMAEQIVEEIARANPGSKVDLPEFYIRKYPVTNRAWRDYVRANLDAAPPPYIPTDWNENSPDFFAEKDADLPIVGLDFKHICSYLRWKGTRLPTAWEWERAARGTEGKLFPWGDCYDSTKCNMRDSGNDRLLPVDHYEQHHSPDGVCDMVGNAAEWVDRRVFSSGYLYQPFRGGSFRDFCLYALTMRDSAEAGVRYTTDESNPEAGETAFDWVGFRDVIDLDPDPELEQQIVDLPEVSLRVGGRETRVKPFAMSRYAVSNLEYWEFTQTTGHSCPENWNLTDDPPFPANHRHLPVVNITHRDALAFCLWKSRVVGRMIRLPTPAQWLAAVDSGEGRRYPWGNDFNLQHCNSMYSGWGKRLPVFALRKGASKHGIYNLVGNVCEWVTPFEVRGGGWQDELKNAANNGFRFGVRQTADGAFQRNDVGFRYVANERKE